jgi:Tol biopolymer transport system component
MTPDGRWVVFTSIAGGSESAMRVPIAGGAPEVVASLMTRAAVSPDGRSVAGFYRETPTSPLVLGVVPIEGGPALHTFPRAVTTTGTVRWTADGKALLYTAAERANIWLQPIAGGEPTRVTNFVEGTIARFDLSPDGQTIVMARGIQSRDAFLIRNFR